MKPLTKRILFPAFLAATGSLAAQATGPYRMVRALGQGGGSDVFLAEAPDKRLVALKITKAERHELFDRERRALARMRHDNVVRLEGAARTESGDGVLALEHVPGSAISEYCNARSLSIRERLALFLQVCDGVAHIHERGILHRDLKPQNILVTDASGKPVAKVLDLGLADLGDDEDKPGLIGSVGYMSPEAANAALVPMDERADVYSLGVVLYELLVGEPPVSVTELVRGGILGMRRRLREAVPSLRRRLDGLDVDEVARRRVTTVPVLRRVLRRLEDTVGKAIQRLPDARFRTVAELRQAVRRAHDRLV